MFWNKRQISASRSRWSVVPRHLLLMKSFFSLCHCCINVEDINCTGACHLVPWLTLYVTLNMIWSQFLKLMKVLMVPAVEGELVKNLNFFSKHAKMISKKVLYKCSQWTVMDLFESRFDQRYLQQCFTGFCALYNHRLDKNTRTDMNSFTLAVIRELQSWNQGKAGGPPCEKSPLGPILSHTDHYSLHPHPLTAGSSHLD